jgi:hypothetical protein
MLDCHRDEEAHSRRPASLAQDHLTVRGITPRQCCLHAPGKVIGGGLTVLYEPQERMLHVLLAAVEPAFLPDQVPNFLTRRVYASRLFAST